MTERGKAKLKCPNVLPPCPAVHTSTLFSAREAGTMHAMRRPGAPLYIPSSQVSCSSIPLVSFHRHHHVRRIRNQDTTPRAMLYCCVRCCCCHAAGSLPRLSSRQDPTTPDAVEGSRSLDPGLLLAGGSTTPHRLGRALDRVLELLELFRVHLVCVGGGLCMGGQISGVCVCVCMRGPISGVRR